MSLLPAVVAVATCLPLAVRTALALSSFCHTSYVGRGAKMERPRHKANNPKTLHPGHALGAVGKRVGKSIAPAADQLFLGSGPRYPCTIPATPHM